jgi:hypothetical protein
VGCGGSLNTAPVSGVITVDGRPLANASVTFAPEEQTAEAPISNGKTDADGRYTLAVTATGDPGAVLGTHTVRVAYIGEETNSDIGVPNPANQVPPHQLSFEVKAGPNEANFDLKSGASK